MYSEDVRKSDPNTIIPADSSVSPSLPPATNCQQICELLAIPKTNLEQLRCFTNTLLLHCNVHWLIVPMFHIVSTEKWTRDRHRFYELLMAYDLNEFYFSFSSSKIVGICEYFEMVGRREEGEGGVEVKAFRNYSGNGLYVWN